MTSSSFLWGAGRDAEGRVGATVAPRELGPGERRGATLERARGGGVAEATMGVEEGAGSMGGAAGVALGGVALTVCATSPALVWFTTRKTIAARPRTPPTARSAARDR